MRALLLAGLVGLLVHGPALAQQAPDEGGGATVSGGAPPTDPRGQAPTHEVAPPGGFPEASPGAAEGSEGSRGLLDLAVLLTALLAGGLVGRGLGRLRLRPPPPLALPCPAPWAGPLPDPRTADQRWVLPEGERRAPTLLAVVEALAAAGPVVLVGEVPDADARTLEGAPGLWRWGGAADDPSLDAALGQLGGRPLLLQLGEQPLGPAERPLLRLATGGPGPVLSRDHWTRGTMISER